MAEGFSRTAYNERFLLSNPLSTIAGSRSTIHRAKKRKFAELQLAERDQDCDDDTQPIPVCDEMDTPDILHHDQSEEDGDTCLWLTQGRASSTLSTEPDAMDEFEILCERSGFNPDELDVAEENQLEAE